MSSSANLWTSARSRYLPKKKKKFHTNSLVNLFCVCSLMGLHTLKLKLFYFYFDVYTLWDYAQIQVDSFSVSFNVNIIHC